MNKLPIWGLIFTIVLLSLHSIALGQTIYDFEIIARTGMIIDGYGPIADLGSGPSINDLGKVAFIAHAQEFNPDPNSRRDGRVFVDNGGIIERNFGTTSLQIIGEDIQINDLDQATWQDTVLTNFDSFIRRLDTVEGGSTIGTGSIFFTTPFRTVLPWPTINDSGLVVFSADLKTGGRVLASRNGGSGPHNISPLAPNIPIPPFLPDLYPMVANNERTIVRWGGAIDSALLLFINTNLDTAVSIATSTGFSRIGGKPGISDDGRVVTFMGAHKSLGAGVYVAAINQQNSVVSFKIIDIPSDSNFEFRVGINHSSCGTINDYTVAYMASSFDGKLGLYTIDINVTNPFSPNISEPSLVVEVGSPIGDLNLGTVKEIGLYDPVNNNGQLVFWIRSTDAQAIVRTTSPVEMRVDADRDGMISFERDSDKTTVDTPYRFWLNDDDDAHFNLFNPEDRRAIRDPRNLPILRDDGLDRLESNTQDFSDNVIDHFRDLEDFAQLKIINSIKATNLLLDGYSLALETTGGIRINLFPAVEFGQRYILDPQIAKKQAAETAINQSHFFPPNRVRGASSITPFLFEGKAAGEGFLRVVLRKPNGTRVASGCVHLQLFHVGDMYERAQSTSDGILESDEARFRFLPPYSPEYRAAPHIVGYQDDTPGFTPPPGEEPTLIVFVHGCCINARSYRLSSDNVFKRLWWQGYRGRFASFRWPAIETSGFLRIPATFNEQEFRAWKYGTAFRDYLNDIQTMLPTYTINVLAHSQGNVVVTEALKLGAPVKNYVLSQAALPAGCYDSNPALVDNLTEMGINLINGPAPYLASELGYAGYCPDSVALHGVRLVNFFNRQDNALGAWKWNNALHKPDQGIAFLDGIYVFDATIRESHFEVEVPDPITFDPNQPLIFSHIVTDPHESMAFVSRSQTQAIGQESKAIRPFVEAVDLHKEFGFGSASIEHSSQFVLAIQNVHGYYKRLLEVFGLQK